VWRLGRGRVTVGAGEGERQRASEHLLSRGSFLYSLAPAPPKDKEGDALSESRGALSSGQGSLVCPPPRQFISEGSSVSSPASPPQWRCPPSPPPPPRGPPGPGAATRPSLRPAFPCPRHLQTPLSPRSSGQQAVLPRHQSAPPFQPLGLCDASIRGHTPVDPRTAILMFLTPV